MDVDAARLERVASQFGVARRYAGYERMLAEVELDAVAVCVPPRLHSEVALAVLEAGKHLFVEKPLALTLRDCDRMIESAARPGAAAAMVGFNMRWHRHVREAREILRRGGLGRIKLVRTALTSGVSFDADFPAWRALREEGGGAVFELGVHHFDLVRFLLGGEAEEVFADWREDETATVAARMSCGAQVLSAFCEGTDESHEIEIFGERGRLASPLPRGRSGRGRHGRLSGTFRFDCAASRAPRALCGMLRRRETGRVRRHNAPRAALRRTIASGARSSQRLKTGGAHSNRARRRRVEQTKRAVSVGMKAAAGGRVRRRAACP